VWRLDHHRRRAVELCVPGRDVGAPDVLR
jgi:hypothetical protein